MALFGFVLCALAVLNNTISSKPNNYLFQELFGALSTLFNICDQVGARCQLQEGSLLGAVKLSTILPWERDADIAVLSSHFHHVINLHQTNPIGKLKICKACFRFY